MKCNSVLIILTHIGIGGTEIQTLNIIKALTLAGYKVSVLCLYRNIPTMVQSYIDAGAFVEIVSPEYNNYDAKITYYSGFKNFKFLFVVLKNTLKKIKPDIVHVQYMTPGATIILMLKYLFKVKKIIATSHTAADIYSLKALKLLRFITKHCLSGFQCITETAEKGYFGTSQLFNETTHVGPGTHFTIHNALPPFITLLETPKSFHNKKNITLGVVSRLEKIKGMDLVVPAFAKVISQYPDTKLLVVGDGSLRSLMEHQAIEFNIINNVSFVGRKNQNELQQWYDKIDILLMPSRSEGFGLTAIEGMARGCIPVVANIGGLPEVVSDNSGLLHKSTNIDDIANKIIYASQNLNKYSNLALKRAQKFTPYTFNKSIKLLYNKLF